MELQDLLMRPKELRGADRLSAARRMEYIEAQLKKLREAGVEKPIIKKWLTDRASECYISMQKAPRQVSSGYMSDLAKESEDQKRYREERERRAKDEERAEALDRSAKRDNAETIATTPGGGMFY